MEKIAPILIVASLLCIIIPLFLGVLISRSIRNPIRKLQEAMKLVENGDFTASYTYDSKDEIGQLVQSFNIMTDSVKELVATASASAEELLASSEELSANATQTVATTTQIASAAESVSQSASGTQENVESVAIEFKTIHTYLSNINETTNNIFELAKTSENHVNEGMVAVHSNSQQMVNMSNEIEKSNEVLTRLNEKTSEVAYFRYN